MGAVDSDAAISELVDVLEIAAVGTAESVLLKDGSCVPPTMHMISNLTDSPYVGYVLTRPFYRGADSAAAMAAMGALPAAMRARRLVLTWEHADLCTALELPGEGFPTGVVVIDAGPERHEVRWHPFAMQVGALAASGYPSITPLWGRAVREGGGWLPGPVTELLATWRAGGDAGQLREVYERLQREGFTVHWMADKDSRYPHRDDHPTPSEG